MTDLALEVAPAHSDLVQIDGFDVTYRDGTRRGEQHIGGHVVVHAVRA